MYSILPTSRTILIKNKKKNKLEKSKKKTTKHQNNTLENMPNYSLIIK